MRKRVAVGLAVFLFPWLLSLGCMQVREWQGETGQSEVIGYTDAGVAGEAGDSGEAEAGDSDVAGVSEAQTGGESGLTSGPQSVESGPQRRILLKRNNMETYMLLENYLPGVLVCQINPEYALEALKCQAVIVRTYICRLMGERREIREEELDLDYLGLDSLTSQQARERAALSLETCSLAVRETTGVVMTYRESCILPLFHAVSSGRTRTGAGDYPYLQAVSSPWDIKRENYQTELSWTAAEFAERISQIPDACPVSADELPEKIQTVEKDEAGYVLNMKIGEKVYAGEEIQYALGLPSPCFSVSGEQGNIRVLTRGIGHGYGLSQAGADSMAKEGWGYEDILSYYYKNISLISE